MYIIITQVAFVIFIFTDNMHVRHKIKQGLTIKKGRKKIIHINIKFLSFLYIYIY